MVFDWTPGERIAKLPRLLRLPALIWRNIVFFPHNLKCHRQQQAVDCRDAYSTEEIRKSLALSVQYIHGADVSGDVAEFGTMTGRTATILAKKLSEYGETRRLLLFDSFEGLPESNSPADRQAPQVRSGVWSAGTCRGVTSSQLLAMCRKYLPEPQVVIFEGWFSDTLPTVAADTRLALLHIDSDLYQSAMDVLDYCFSQQMIACGAALHFDDWDCNRADPACGERRAWAEVVQKYEVRFSDCGQYGWGARKFLVHSYRGVKSADSP